MLHKDDHCLESGRLFPHPARIVGKCEDVTFVATVEEDGTRVAIPVVSRSDYTLLKAVIVGVAKVVHLLNGTVHA